MANATGPDEMVVVITRVFDAPREAVFDAWLDAEQLAQWMGPRNVRAEIESVDARVGGRYRIIMHPDGGGTPIVGGVYREIARPEKLVLTWQWENGGPDGGPGADTLITLRFAELGGKTEMTMRHEGFANVDARNSHNQGWNGSFDKLAEVLAA